MAVQNIYELAALFNLEPSEDLFFEAFPINDGECIIRFARRSDGTCIYHKIVDYEMIPGGIIMWSGALIDIPASYHLCDGTVGTPDLREKFVMGAADGIDPGGVGGNINHNHTGTTDGHKHIGIPFVDNYSLAAGAGQTQVTTDTITTDNADGRPPYYEIAYIMKL